MTLTTHPSRDMLPLDTEGMTDIERDAALSYAQMIGLDLPREQMLEEIRAVAWDAPVRKVRPRA